MSSVIESLKEAAKNAAKAAQQALPDMPPNPIERGTAVVNKVPPGAVIMPAPTIQPPK